MMCPATDRQPATIDRRIDKHGNTILTTRCPVCNRKVSVNRATKSFPSTIGKH